MTPEQFNELTLLLRCGFTGVVIMMLLIGLKIKN